MKLVRAAGRKRRNNVTAVWGSDDWASTSTVEEAETDFRPVV
jgi:hypothetical protein